MSALCLQNAVFSIENALVIKKKFHCLNYHIFLLNKGLAISKYRSYNIYDFKVFAENLTFEV